MKNNVLNDIYLNMLLTLRSGDNIFVFTFVERYNIADISSYSSSFIFSDFAKVIESLIDEVDFLDKETALIPTTSSDPYV